MSAKKGKFDFLAEERQQRDAMEDATETQPIESAQAEKGTSAQTIKRTNALSIKATMGQETAERKSSGQRIRTDLLRAVKILSAETGIPQYVLIEEALELYLTNKRAK